MAHRPGNTCRRARTRAHSRATQDNYSKEFCMEAITKCIAYMDADPELAKKWARMRHDTGSSAESLEPRGRLQGVQRLRVP